MLLLSFVLASPTISRPRAEGGAREPLEFALGIVETYFEGDVDAYLDRLAEVVYSLDGEGSTTVAELRRTVPRLAPFPFGRDYSSHSMEDYLRVYAPRILTFDEYRRELGEPLRTLAFDDWKPDDDDLLFLGNEVRPGREPFLWDDPLIFMITDSTGEWRVIALGG